MADVLVKDTFSSGGILDSFGKLYSQNDSEWILQIHAYVADKLIRSHFKSGAYLVKKDNGCCLAKIIETMPVGPFLISLAQP